MNRKKGVTSDDFLRNTTIMLGATFLLLVFMMEGCAGSSHLPKEKPFPPLVAKVILVGNQCFPEHRWTAAMGKFEEAIQVQPKMAEAHYNLGLTLNRQGPVSAAGPHIIEAANFAPGHPVIWNAPPFRIRYGRTVCSRCWLQWASRPPTLMRVNSLKRKRS